MTVNGVGQVHVRTPGFCSKRDAGEVHQLSVLLAKRPRGRCHGLVVLIQLRLQQHQRRQAAGHGGVRKTLSQ